MMKTIKKARLKIDFYDISHTTTIEKGTVVEQGFAKDYYLKPKQYFFGKDFVEKNPGIFEVFEEKKGGRWKPVNGEQYYFVGSGGSKSLTNYVVGNEPDKYRIKKNNIFKTFEDAERWLEAEKFLLDLQEQINGDWEPDWEDGEKIKYFIFYDRNTKQKTIVTHTLAGQLPGILYFRENPKDFCERKDISWDEVTEQFKIYLRIE